MTMENGEWVQKSFGSVISYWCRPLDCLGDAGCDIFKEYEPGCCLFGNDINNNNSSNYNSSSCTNETVCGETCPPGVCRTTREGCRSVACIECDKGPNGEELYNVAEFSSSIDCLSYGTKTTEGEEGTYNWVIACGPIEKGGIESENRAVGEYDCHAYKQGPNVTVSQSGIWPCHWFQMVECGCAPVDVHPFGNVPPNPDVGWTPCVTTEDCPLLCSDAGMEHVQNACYAFEQFPNVEVGIDYFEGHNWANYNMFEEYGHFNSSKTQITIY